MPITPETFYLIISNKHKFLDLSEEERVWQRIEFGTCRPVAFCSPNWVNFCSRFSNCILNARRINYRYIYTCIMLSCTRTKIPTWGQMNLKPNPEIHDFKTFKYNIVIKEWTMTRGNWNETAQKLCILPAYKESSGTKNRRSVLRLQWFSFLKKKINITEEKQYQLYSWSRLFSRISY